MDKPLQPRIKLMNSSFWIKGAAVCAAPRVPSVISKRPLDKALAKDASQEKTERIATKKCVSSSRIWSVDKIWMVTEKNKTKPPMDRIFLRPLLTALPKMVPIGSDCS